MLILVKSHVKAYTKKSGVFVKPHETKTVKKSKNTIFESARSYVLENGKTEETHEIEFGCAYSPSGRILVQRRGERSAINFTEEECNLIKQKKGATLVHNHPSSASLSKEDLMFAKKHGCDIYAIGHDGTDYHAKVTYLGNDLTRCYYKISSYVRIEFQNLISNKKITDNEANRYHHHLINSLLDGTGYIEYQAVNIPTLPDEIEKVLKKLTQEFKYGLPEL